MRAIRWATASIALLAVDFLYAQNPSYSTVGDPPVIYTIVETASPAQRQLVRISFNRFGNGYMVSRFAPAIVPQPHPASRKGPRLGGGTLDPDPDEHQFEPDLWPEGDDFPLPEPPLPLPDYPDEDPFDGLPEPPPFPPDLPEFTDLSDGIVSIVDTGVTSPPKGVNQAAAGVTEVPVCQNPAGLAVSPDHKTMYVACKGANQIAIVNLVAKVKVGNIPMPGIQPYSLAITQDGKTLYAGEFLHGGGVYAVNIASQTFTQLRTPANLATGITVTPDGTQVWVANFFGNVQIYDTLTNALIGQVQITSPWKVAFNPNGTRAYISAGAQGVPGAVFVVDPGTLGVLTSVPVDVGPRTVHVTPSGRHVFVNNYDSASISQISTLTNQVVRTIKLGGTGDLAIGLAFAY